MKIYEAVQKLLVGTDRHTDTERQTDRLVIEKPKKAKKCFQVVYCLFQVANLRHV
jgi:hypothetical protein